MGRPEDRFRTPDGLRSIVATYAKPSLGGPAVTEPDDETIAVLLHLGDLLKRTAAQDLKSLLSGDSKLVIVPKGWRPQPPGTSPRKPTAPDKASLPAASVVRAQLVEAPTLDARRELLHALEMTQ